MPQAPQKQPYTWIVGIDEVGRGPIAGPVTVCAVAIRAAAYKASRWSGLTDSKQMTKSAREKWYTKAKLLEKEGKIRIVLASQTAAQIDKKGIADCIRLCIAKSLQMLDLDPNQTRILLDGSLKAPIEYANQETVIKGDQKHKIISLASVIAKVSRDAYMAIQARTYPEYGWQSNAGYGTARHYKALKKLGFTRLHRKSFLTKFIDKNIKKCYNEKNKI